MEEFGDLIPSSPLNGHDRQQPGAGTTGNRDHDLLAGLRAAHQIGCVLAQLPESYVVHVTKVACVLPRGVWSGIDLLFTMDEPLSLMQLSALSDRLGVLLGVPVDLVPDTAVHPALRDRILAEAVPL